MTLAEPTPSVLRTATRAVSIDADPALVYAFVADPANLPTWAVGFCQAIRRDAESDRWIATTAHGDMPIRYVTTNSAGTIDFHFSPSPGVEIAAFSRVIPNGNGAEYVFTQLQSAGMPDDVFEAQTHALSEELQVLRGVVHARAACRI
jgi:hypothetical protein